MLETILTIDDTNRLFRYAIDEQPLLPIQDIVGTMQVSEGSCQTELRWDVSFTITDETAQSRVEPAIREMYAAGAAGLEARAQ